MAVKIFLTGATGYIGGDALHQLYKRHPDFEYALLSANLRGPISSYVGGLILILSVRVLTHILDTADSSDHAGAATAISKGLVQGHSPSRPGFWLHTGGTGILTYFDSEVKKVFGELDEKVFNDYEGVEELVNLPAAAFHRNVDEIVLNTGNQHADSVKTAIVCPPTIYGEGRGPISGRGRQVYELAHFILEQKYCPRIGKGLSRWNNVHVHDLSVVFELLVEAALDPSRKDDAQIWGLTATSLLRTGSTSGGICLIKGAAPEVRELSFEEAVKSPAGFEAASWGMNSRGVAVRARKVLGWKPQEKSLEDEVPTIVRSEAVRAGL
ncbi:nucleoside-diphosphate-sugar epimerase [Colletotrichum tofieldiae]|nr:nucleoside-diphosphate-sugar epimerase [Colletotrichum tofieldiae]